LTGCCRSIPKKDPLLYNVYNIRISKFKPMKRFMLIKFTKNLSFCKLVSIKKSKKNNQMMMIGYKILNTRQVTRVPQGTEKFKSYKKTLE
jgi:hypothetical protein